MLEMIEGPKRKGPHMEEALVTREVCDSIYRRFMDGRSTFELSKEFDLRQRTIARIVADEVERAQNKAFRDGYRRGRLSVLPPGPIAA